MNACSDLAQLNALMASMPDLMVTSTDDDTLRWLARVRELAHPYLDLKDRVDLDDSIGALTLMALEDVVVLIRLRLHRAIARAEEKCGSSSTSTGGLVQVGEFFKAFAEISTVIKTAKTELFIVDPYMNDTVLTEFVIVANEKANIRLLVADEPQTQTHRQALLAASKRWVAQYQPARPLEVRKAASRALHDRVIFIDRSAAWLLSQSIKDLAARSPATVIPLDTNLVSDKLAAYEGMWNTASSL